MPFAQPARSIPVMDTDLGQIERRLYASTQAAPTAPTDAPGDILESINDALNRLETGSFGYCESCGEPIALARLIDNPAVRRCKGCSGD